MFQTRGGGLFWPHDLRSSADREHLHVSLDFANSLCLGAAASAANIARAAARLRYRRVLAVLASHGGRSFSLWLRVQFAAPTVSAQRIPLLHDLRTKPECCAAGAGFLFTRRRGGDGRRWGRSGTSHDWCSGVLVARA